MSSDLMEIFSGAGRPFRPELLGPNERVVAQQLLDPTEVKKVTGIPSRYQWLGSIGIRASETEEWRIHLFQHPDSGSIPFTEDGPITDPTSLGTARLVSPRTVTFIEEDDLRRLVAWQAELLAAPQGKTTEVYVEQMMHRQSLPVVEVQPGSAITIGRGERAAFSYLFSGNKAISDSHCTAWVNEVGQVTITNLSENGTWVTQVIALVSDLDQGTAN